MKKLILVIAAFTITIGAYAQTDSLNRKFNQRDMYKNKNQDMEKSSVLKSHPDGVLMQNGKILMVKTGEVTTLDHDMTMSNGTKIMADGNYIKRDGTTMMLKEGQHMDMSGNLIFIKALKDRNMYLIRDSVRKEDL